MDDVVVKFFVAAIVGGARQVVSGQAILQIEKMSATVLLKDSGSRRHLSVSLSTLVESVTVSGQRGGWQRREVAR
jgi:hypothetical protein